MKKFKYKEKEKLKEKRRNEKKKTSKNLIFLNNDKRPLLDFVTQDFQH